MKNLFFFFFLIMTFETFAQEKVLCELKWTNHDKAVKLELLFLPQACEFPEGNKNDCAILRFTGLDGQVREGASPLRTGPETFCLSKKDVEIFGPSQADDPFVWVKCEQGAAKAFVRLESPDKKNFKDCSFPIFKKGKSL